MLTNKLVNEIKTRIDQLKPEMISLLQDLVRIPSLTGEETEVQQYLSPYLKGMGLQVDEWCPFRSDVSGHPAFSDDGLPLGERPVVVAGWPGSGSGRSMILNGHVDVVPTGDPAGWTDDPWSGAIRNERLYGRGSCDMKGGLVSGITAIAALRKMDFDLRGDLLMECVIGEETGGIGTLATIIRGYKADAAIVLEPTRMNLCPLGAGAASFRLRIPGLAAHGAMRLEGVSAIEKFFLIYNALSEFEHRRQSAFQHPLFDSDTLVAPLSIGKVQAGDWLSTVPENLIAEGRYGILPGENISEARNKFEACLKQTAQSDSWLNAHRPTVEWFEGQFEPAETPTDAPIIRVLSECHRHVNGTVPGMHGVPYGSDLRFFTNNAGMHAVLYGPGDVAVAHSLNEFVPLEEVFNAALTVALAVIAWQNEE